MVKLRLNVSGPSAMVSLINVILIVVLVAPEGKMASTGVES